MASTLLFIVMVIMAAILLFTSSLTSTIGAVDSFASSYYNSDIKLRSAHQYLTISAALGWSSLALLIVILIVAAAAGGFSTVKVSDQMLLKPNPTPEEISAVSNAEKELSSGKTTRTILIIILILIALITFLIGILSAIGAVYLGELDQQDSNSRSAYTQSIISSISGVGGIGIMFVAIFVYISIRSDNDSEIGKLQLYEQQLSPK